MRAGQLIKRYFLTGLLIWIPLGITFLVLQFIINKMDGSISLLPKSYQPKELFGFDIPGLGTILTLLIILVTGIFATNIIGQKLVNRWNKLLARIPVVSPVYNGVKQVSDTLFAPSGQAFRKTLLVQYPHAGSWTIALLTGQPGGDVINHLTEDYVTVFVPATPNPTSGFFLMYPRNQTIELNMSVDDALKYIISMGVIIPPIPAHSEVPNSSNH